MTRFSRGTDGGGDAEKNVEHTSRCLRTCRCTPFVPRLKRVTIFRFFGGVFYDPGNYGIMLAAGEVFYEPRNYGIMSVAIWIING